MPLLDDCDPWKDAPELLADGDVFVGELEEPADCVCLCPVWWPAGFLVVAAVPLPEAEDV
jgi:hypothetical protein